MKTQELTEPKARSISIGTTVVHLTDLGEGQGRIVVDSFEEGAFNYYWGSMGCDLENFLLNIDRGYFSMKLCPHDRDSVFSGKNTAKAIRKHIREECDLPWYEHREDQKELRKFIKEIETIPNNDTFVNHCFSFEDELWNTDSDFRDEIKDVFLTEPWHFIASEPSSKVIFLQELLPKLQNKIKESQCKN